jgi:hypothetical protein
MNADPHIIAEYPAKKILLIHVGKCAGGTITRVLKERVSSNTKIFEMHCFDANERIQKVTDIDIPGLHFIIAARDPVERFISAYNWEKHYMLASGKLKNSEYEKLFEEFYPLNKFVLDLEAKDPILRRKARQLATFGHLRMGQCWYTPPEVLSKLPVGRTFLCDNKSLKRDLNLLLRSLGARKIEVDDDIGRDKSDYKDGYSNAATFFSTDLSSAAREVLKRRLRADFDVYETLNRNFRKNFDMLT